MDESNLFLCNLELRVVRHIGSGILSFFFLFFLQMALTNGIFFTARLLHLQFGLPLFWSSWRMSPPVAVTPRILVWSLQWGSGHLRHVFCTAVWYWYSSVGSPGALLSSVSQVVGWTLSGKELLTVDNPETSGVARTFGAHGQRTIRGPSPYFITLFLWTLPHIHPYSDFAQVISNRQIWF